MNDLKDSDGRDIGVLVDSLNENGFAEFIFTNIKSGSEIPDTLKLVREALLKRFPDGVIITPVPTRWLREAARFRCTLVEE